jgi:hypothetical protein
VLLLVLFWKSIPSQHGDSPRSGLQYHYAHRRTCPCSARHSPQEPSRKQEFAFNSDLLEMNGGMTPVQGHLPRSGSDDVNSLPLKWSKSLGRGARACDDGVDLVGRANKCSAHVPEFACIGNNNQLL